MKKIQISVCLVLLVFAQFTLSAVPSTVPNPQDQRPQSNLLPNSNSNTGQSTISRRQASDLARDRFDGRVLSIRMDRNNWRVRMDRDGTVFNVLVNSSTGAIRRSDE